MRRSSLSPGQAIATGLLLLMALLPPGMAVLAQEPVKIAIGMLRVTGDDIVPLSRIDVPPADNGLAGAQLGIRDNQTTGRFTNQDFTLQVESAGSPEAAVATLAKLGAAGVRFVLLDAPAAAQVKLADAAASKDMLLFNISATDDALRAENCRANLFHIAPSRAMLADALAQYLAWKKWSRWLLIGGVKDADKAFLDALKRAATRFGAKIVEERSYQEPGGSRRSDTGHEQVQQQMAVFTQRATAYDVLVVADESEVFGAYLPYRTWDARPVAGTAGLIPATWHAAHEGWGATQLQTRFERNAKRFMRPLDYQAWEAVRIIGEAATRSKSNDPKVIREHILRQDFGLGAFKGQALNFRTWDRQLRQPILLTTLQMPVTVSPQPGFLHRYYETDTLGIDEPETKCRAR